MKCYYEVLGVPIDADDSQIKTAFKKLALKWHPDKNLGNVEEAKEQFQLLQQAYEVLSDRQERAWYDKHREQILHGSDSQYKDESLDIFQYFTTSCFKGYGDDPNGFYSVYRNVFEKLAKEDLPFIEKNEFCEIPSFGNSQSDYDEVVNPFYAYWSNYSTKKSYTWLDPYSANEIKNRRIFKLAEKENKKVRQKAKKERNEEVRNLVSFVRKRDKRVQEHSKQLEAKILENRQKHEQISKQKRLEQKKLNDSHSQAEWLKFDNVKSELEEIERQLAEQFGEQLTDSEEDSNEEIEEEEYSLYCVACNKSFKTIKAQQNHERSKKHKENLRIIQEAMLKDEENVENLLENEVINSEDNLVENKINTENSDQIKNENESDIDNEIEYENDFTDRTKTKKKNKKKGKICDPFHFDFQDSDDVIINKDGIGSFSVSDNESGSKLKKRIKKSKKVKNTNKSVIKDSDHDESKTESEKSAAQKNNDLENMEDINQKSTKPDKNRIKSEITSETVKDSNKNNQTRKNKSNKKIENDETITVDVNHCCVTCKVEFPSKNKLFDHLKSSGHSIYLPKATKKNKEKIQK